MDMRPDRLRSELGSGADLFREGIGGVNYRQDYASSFVIFPGVEDAVDISDEVDSRSRDEWLRHWGDWRLTNPRCLSRLTLWS